MRPIGAAKLRPRDHLFRAAVCHVLDRARGRYEGPDAIARQLFGDDPVTPLVLRAATVPAAVGSAPWAGVFAQAAVADAIVGLAPASAAAEVISRGLQVSLAGVASISVPYRIVSAADAGGFLTEGGVIPVKQLNLTAGPVLTPNKFGSIAVFTRELEKYGAQGMMSVCRQILGEAAALALDAAVFSSTAASSIRPAGILNGVTPITPTAGGGQAALATDIGNIFEALASAGAGVDVVLIANPGQAASLKIWAGPKFDYPVLASAALAPGTVIALEAGSFVSGFSSEPEFESSTETVLHMEDTTPLPLGSVGSPNTIAAPTRSLWQTDCIALRMILRCGWGVRAPGHVQVINSVTW